MTDNGLRAKPKNTSRKVGIILSIIWAAVIFTLSCIPGSDLMPGHPDIINVICHFCEYVVLGVFLTMAFNSQKRPLWKSALYALVIASAFGATDEFHQLFTPGRFSDWHDWLTDTLGGLVGAAATILTVSSQRVKHRR